MSQQAKPKVIVLTITLVVIIVIASVLVPWSAVAQAIVNVIGGSSFTLTASPQTITVAPLQVGTATVTVHRNSGYETYSFACSPAGSCYLQPSSGVANPDFSTILHVSSGNAEGQYQVTVTATGVSEQKTVTVTVIISSTVTTTSSTSSTTSSSATISTTASATETTIAGITFLDVTPTNRLSEEQYGYVLARGGLDPTVKSLKVQLPKDDSAAFRAGVQDWYDASVKFTQMYGGSSLQAAYPITFTTLGVDSVGDENIRVIYVSNAASYCGYGQSPGAIACFIPTNNGVAGLWTGGTIYFDTYFHSIQGDRDGLIRKETTHEFGHVLGLGDFYNSPTCFGYTSSIMCSSNPLSTIDEYAAIVKWHQIQASPPQSLYGILVLPSNMINAPLLTSATTTTTAIVASTSFQNGGFESGNLSPWTALGQGQVVVTSQQVHSGNYAISITAPPENNPNGGGNIMTVQQEFAPMPLPLRFSVYIYNSPYPTTYCSHPYTQFSLVGTTGHAIEAGFSYPGGEAWAYAYQTWHYTGSYPANQWVQLSVEVYQDHFNFYVNGQSVYQGQASEGWTFASIYKVQLFDSCSAVAYFDDVSITPINQSIVTPVIEAWDRFWAWIWCQFGYCST